MSAGKARRFGGGVRSGAILIPLLLILFACRAGAPGLQQDPPGGNSGEKGASETGQIPPHLLPALKVRQSSCYAFIQPDKDSLYFGPLLTGESVQRLDSEGDWLRIWIPRLRIAGWVEFYMVAAPSERVEVKYPVPCSVLTSVTVMSGEINIRQRPTTDSLTVGTAKQGEEFWLLNEKNGWFRVWVARLARAGWVYGGLVTKNRP